MANQEPRRSSVLLTPEKKLTVLLLKALIYLDGLTENGMKNIVNVYLVASQGWSPLSAAWIWFIEMSTRLLYQPVIGTIVDRVKIHKYTILVIIALLKIGSGVCILTSTSFGIMSLKSVMDGIVAASFLSTSTAMTLGVVGKTRFHKKSAALNNIFKFSGVATGVIIFGLVSYYIKDVQDVFYVLVADGIVMLVCTFFMLSDGKGAVDHRRARGRSTIIHTVSHLTPVQLLSSHFMVDTDDDSEGSKDELSRHMTKEPAVQDKEKKAEGGEVSEEPEAEVVPEAQAANTFETSIEALGYTQVMTYKQMYADPKRRKSLIFLSLVFFFYHLANSTAGPLLGQYISTKTESNRQNSIPIMSSLMLVNMVFKILTNWFLKNDKATKIGYTNVLLIGGAALFVRLVLVGIFVRFDVSPWALGATQILEGIGGGCLGLMLMLYSHLLSRRTGHFNFNMAIVNSWKTLGSMVGIIVGGAVAQYSSYENAFWVLTGVAFLPIVCALGISVPDLKSLD